MTHLLILSWPYSAEQSVHFWRSDDGQPVARGEALLADLAQQENPEQIVLLAPSARVVCHWHELGDLPQKQAEAAAMAMMMERSLEPQSLHCAAQLQPDDRVLSAHMDRIAISTALELLARYELVPYCIVPAALLLDAPESGAEEDAQTEAGQEPVAGLVASSIGDEKLLRGLSLATEDDPLIRSHFAPHGEVKPLPTAQAELQMLRNAVMPPVNLCCGDFSRRDRRFSISAQQWRVLGIMLLALVMVSLLLGLASIWRSHQAAAREDAKTIALAAQIGVQASTAQEAEQRSAQMAAQSGMGSGFLQLSSALYSTLENAPTVKLRDLGYGQNGVLRATLSAAKNEEINPVLIALQRQGYVMTATARQEASGLSVADITMRMP